MGSSMPAVDLPQITDLGVVPTGDMPGDKVQIGPAHDAKARAIFPGSPSPRTGPSSPSTADRASASPRSARCSRTTCGSTASART